MVCFAKRDLEHGGSRGKFSTISVSRFPEILMIETAQRQSPRRRSALGSFVAAALISTGAVGQTYGSERWCEEVLASGVDVTSRPEAGLEPIEVSLLESDGPCRRLFESIFDRLESMRSSLRKAGDDELARAVEDLIALRTEAERQRSYGTSLVIQAINEVLVGAIVERLDETWTVSEPLLEAIGSFAEWSPQPDAWIAWAREEEPEIGEHLEPLLARVAADPDEGVTPLWALLVALAVVASDVDTVDEVPVFFPLAFGDWKGVRDLLEEPNVGALLLKTMGSHVEVKVTRFLAEFVDRSPSRPQEILDESKVEHVVGLERESERWLSFRSEVGSYIYPAATVVALLTDQRSGELAWRHAFEQSDAVHDAILFEHSRLSLVTAAPVVARHEPVALTLTFSNRAWKPIDLPVLDEVVQVGGPSSSTAWGYLGIAVHGEQRWIPVDTATDPNPLERGFWHHWSVPRNHSFTQTLYVFGLNSGESEATHEAATFPLRVRLLAAPMVIDGGTAGDVAGIVSNEVEVVVRPQTTAERRCWAHERRPTLERAMSDPDSAWVGALDLEGLARLSSDLDALAEACEGTAYESYLHYVRAALAVTGARQAVSRLSTVPLRVLETLAAAPEFPFREAVERYGQRAYGARWKGALELLDEGTGELSLWRMRPAGYERVLSSRERARAEDEGAGSFLRPGAWIVLALSAPEDRPLEEGVIVSFTPATVPPLEEERMAGTIVDTPERGPLVILMQAMSGGVFLEVHEIAMNEGGGFATELPLEAELRERDVSAVLAQHTRPSPRGSQCVRDRLEVVVEPGSVGVTAAGDDGGEDCPPLTSQLDLEDLTWSDVPAQERSTGLVEPSRSRSGVRAPVMSGGGLLARSGSCPAGRSRRGSRERAACSSVSRRVRLPGRSSTSRVPRCC